MVKRFCFNIFNITYNYIYAYLYLYHISTTYSITNFPEDKSHVPLSIDKQMRQNADINTILDKIDEQVLVNYMKIDHETCKYFRNM